jgi:nitrogen fixation protein NifX
VVQHGSLPREVAFRIGAAARELSGVELRTLVATLIELTDNQLTLEAFERIGPRVLRDALRLRVASAGSADSHRAVQRLRTASPAFAADAPTVPERVEPPQDGWLNVAFASNEGHWLDASLAHCRRVLVYRVGAQDARLVDVRGASTHSGRGRAWQGRLGLVGDCQVVYTLSVAGPAISALVSAQIHTVRVQHAVPCAHILGRLQSVVGRAPPPWMRKAMARNAGAIPCLSRGVEHDR